MSLGGVSSDWFFFFICLCRSLLVRCVSVLWSPWMSPANVVSVQSHCFCVMSLWCGSLTVYFVSLLCVSVLWSPWMSPANVVSVQSHCFCVMSLWCGSLMVYFVSLLCVSVLWSPLMSLAAFLPSRESMLLFYASVYTRSIHSLQYLSAHSLQYLQKYPLTAIRTNEVSSHCNTWATTHVGRDSR